MNLNPVGWASSSLRLVARLFNSGVNSAVPVTAISEAPIGVANADLALVAKGTGATLAQVPDGTRVGGNKRGTFATDLQKQRGVSSQVASGDSSVIGGGYGNTALSSYSFVGGGINSTASGSNATVGGGQGHTASGFYSTVAGGDTNNSNGTYATIGGGSSNTASGSYATVAGGYSNNVATSYSTIAGGNSNTVSGGYATITGGSGNSASGNYTFVAGGRSGTTRSIEGNHVFPACNAPIASTQGVTQHGLLLLGRETIDATATVLTSNSSAASTTNQVILPNNSAYSFSGEVIAGVTGAGNTARWTINGAIKRGANAASTVMVGTTTVTMTHNDAGAAAWIVAVTADTTNGGIAVTVTGAAATTIRWVARLTTTEMTY